MSDRLDLRKLGKLYGHTLYVDVSDAKESEKDRSQMIVSHLLKEFFIDGRQPPKDKPEENVSTI